MKTVMKKIWLPFDLKNEREKKLFLNHCIQNWQKIPSTNMQIFNCSQSDQNPTFFNDDNIFQYRSYRFFKKIYFFLSK